MGFWKKIGKWIKRGNRLGVGVMGVLIAVPAVGMTLIARYDGKFALLGTVVKGVEVFNWKDERYIIQADARAVGLAGALSRHLEHHYRSEGRISKGILHPDRFIQVIKRGNKKYLYLFTFDHKRHKIYKTKYLNGHLESNETLNYWTPFDVMALYFSIPSLIKSEKKHYTFFAVGARKRDGRIDLYLLSPEQWAEVDKTPKFPEKYYYLKVKPYNKELGKGAIYLLIAKENFVSVKSIFPDYILGGDLTGVLTDLKYHPE